jgi:hypothetical protein
MVLTLASGEAGLPHLREQIAQQRFRADHHVIEGLGNREAHAELYRIVMASADRYDLFFKIDADMSFRSDDALRDVIKGIEAYPQVRHFLFPVFDYFTDQEIRGVSLYRSGVSWAPSSDGLFVDPAPQDAKAAWCGGTAVPFLNHGEYVSDFECFSFGVHKLIKVLQRDRTSKKVSKQSGRLFDLERVRRMCRNGGRRRDWMVMRGAAWALREPAYQVMESKAALQSRFDALDVHDRELDQWVEALVRDDRRWRRALMKELGLIGTLRAQLARPPAEKPRTVRIDRPG